MTTWPEPGRCGACTRPARRFPSGRWEHEGRPCALRSQTLFRPLDLPVHEMLVFVADGDDLPQPQGQRREDREMLERRAPGIDWTEHFARPTAWDRVREQLRADAEAGGEEAVGG